METNMFFYGASITQNKQITEINRFVSFVELYGFYYEHLSRKPFVSNTLTSPSLLLMVVLIKYILH